MLELIVAMTVFFGVMGMTIIGHVFGAATHQTKVAAYTVRDNVQGRWWAFRLNRQVQKKGVAR